MKFQVICTKNKRTFNSSEEILKCPCCNTDLVNCGFALICM